MFSSIKLCCFINLGKIGFSWWLPVANARLAKARKFRGMAYRRTSTGA